MLYELLSDIFPESKYKKGFVYAVNILAFKRKTSYLLASKTKNTSETKARPIIIAKKENENTEIFALTTNEDKIGQRPVFDIKKCEIKKTKDECLNIDFYSEKTNMIFAKRNKTKNFRVFYEINIHILDDLENDGYLEYCGKCNEKIIDETIHIIKKYFGVD